MRMEWMNGSGIKTYFTEGGMSRLGQRFVFWAENSPLTNNSSEHMSKDRSFARIVIVRKRQALFETAFTVGRNQMYQASDDKFTKF